MRKNVTLLIALVGIFAAGIAGCGRGGQEGLYVYAEGCFRPPVEELADAYEKKTGTKVEVDYSGCGELLAKIETTRMGDIFVSHTPYMNLLAQRNLLDKGKTVSAIEPVILVQKGNPRDIQGLDDLVNSDADVILPSVEQSTTGNIVRRMLKQADLQEEMKDNIVNRTPEGSGAANAVQMGTADAAIVWNIFEDMRSEKTEAVPIEKKYRMKQETDVITTATFGKVEMDYMRVTVASLTVSEQKEKARDFSRFMASEENWDVWKKHGYLPPQPTRPHPFVTDETRLTLAE